MLGIYQLANMWVARSASVDGSLIALLPQSGITPVSRALSDAVPAYFEHRYLATTLLNQVESQRDPVQESMLKNDLERLPVTSDAEALHARLALLRGEHHEAFEAALRAHSADILNHEIDRAAKHDIESAIGLQDRVVRSLDGERTHREALADAYWHLGVLHNTAAERSVEFKRRMHREAARRAFTDNVTLTPLSGRALLSAAYAEYTLGHFERARRYFADARASDPASASAYAGLARVAAAEHRCDEARTLARRAEHLQPAQADVMQLQSERSCRI